MATRTERRAMQYGHGDDETAYQVHEAAQLDGREARDITGAVDGETGYPGLSLGKAMDGARRGAEERLAHSLGDNFHDRENWNSLAEEIRHSPRWSEAREELHLEVSRNAAEVLSGRGETFDQKEDLAKTLLNYGQENDAAAYMESHPEAAAAANRFRHGFRQEWPDGMNRDHLMDAGAGDALALAEIFRDSVSAVDGNPDAVRATAYRAAAEIAAEAPENGRPAARNLRENLAEALVEANGGTMDHKLAQELEEIRVETGAFTYTKDPLAGREEIARAIRTYAMESGERSVDQVTESEERFLSDTDPAWRGDTTLIYEIYEGIEAEFHLYHGTDGFGNQSYTAADLAMIEEQEYSTGRTKAGNQETRDLRMAYA